MGNCLYDRRTKRNTGYNRKKLDTGLSWLFYYKALQLGDASKVVPIDKFSVVISMILAFVILKEDLTFKTVMGGILITAGTFVMIL